MQIHFVCLGNVFRSRLAEAFFNSLNIPDWRATSSGVWAYKDNDGPIWWPVRQILEENDLLQYTSPHWVDCSPQLLEKADKVIFMHPEVLDAYQARFGKPIKEYEVWDIDDFDPPASRSEEEVVQQARETFGKIKEKVEALIAGSIQPHPRPLS